MSKIHLSDLLNIWNYPNFPTNWNFTGSTPEQNSSTVRGVMHSNDHDVWINSNFWYDGAYRAKNNTTPNPNPKIPRHHQFIITQKF